SQAREAHEVIRATLDQVVGAGTGAKVAILYGGSVTGDNAVALFQENEVDGALVGGASLEAAGFWKIVMAAGSAGGLRLSRGSSSSVQERGRALRARRQGATRPTQPSALYRAPRTLTG